LIVAALRVVVRGVAIAMMPKRRVGSTTVDDVTVMATVEHSHVDVLIHVATTVALSGGKTLYMEIN
jgi:hypothetical protein